MKKDIILTVIIFILCGDGIYYVFKFSKDQSLFNQAKSIPVLSSNSIPSSKSNDIKTTTTNIGYKEEIHSRTDKNVATPDKRVHQIRKNNGASASYPSLKADFSGTTIKSGSKKGMDYAYYNAGVQGESGFPVLLINEKKWNRINAAPGVLYNSSQSSSIMQRTTGDGSGDDPTGGGGDDPVDNGGGANDATPVGDGYIYLIFFSLAYFITRTNGISKLKNLF